MPTFLNQLPKPFFVLAPMYDVTDTVFRQVIAGLSPPDLFFSEFVNADGLQSDGKSKIDFRLKFDESEKPIIAQIWGKNPKNYEKTARQLVAMGFDGVDINMGCPDKAVLKNGCCAALIDNHPLAAEIISATQKGVSGKVPISVKTRIGLRSYDKPWLEFLLSQNLDMLSVHLRTVREMSKVPAHWELMSEIRELRDKISPKTLLVGNGSVQSQNHARQLAKEHKIDGVMIGTGVFQDPFVFADKSPWRDMAPEQKIALYQKHVELFERTWQNGERPVVTLNKFCKIYINGFDGAKELRGQLMQAKSTGELKEILQDLQKDYK